MTTQIPQTMKAMTGDRSFTTRLVNLTFKRSSGDGIKIKDVPVPTIEAEEILIQVSAVALNPVDFKHIDLISPRGSIIGCDYVGKVVKVGQKALGDWRIGDRAAGMVHGGLYPDRGSFAEYLMISGDLAWKVPETIPDEEACTYGVSAVTAMLAINTRLGIPLVPGQPGLGEQDTQILVYAGSTSAGLAAIQIAKLANAQVITTASPHSFDLVRQYGADDVFDYHSSTAIEEIIQKYPHIDRAIDCYSEGGSKEFCAKVIHKNRGKVVTLLDMGKSNVESVAFEFLNVFTVFGVPFQIVPPLGPSFAAHPDDRAAFARFYAALPELCNHLKAPPIHTIDGGLHNLTTGLDMLREGKVSGSKLVARLS